MSDQEPPIPQSGSPEPQPIGWRQFAVGATVFAGGVGAAFVGGPLVLGALGFGSGSNTDFPQQKLSLPHIRYQSMKSSSSLLTSGSLSLFLCPSAQPVK